ncbi:CDP-alcohol phosphatidyltransferase family protein [Pedobacter africanus]|uniref:CDP-diacylglycerol--glycerol-3-phosphate 3-phosphatidyltransferase n=1 Tax=Pedobacter africanus TaxID=151894 RepID=A0A1W2E1D1_9SPHI|nr:CDP-alcohol phosphatidyltransferase family protein [Pedobacter africanus]SMD03046.1 CDP-diacylglycerol--glycerol-3-phosphate 3-phosphatidyltransferase [Pedobacter africanus]
MKKYLKHIPILLIYSRLLFSVLILLLSFIQPEHFRPIINMLLITGLITDVFDGIIARKLNVSTVKLRRMDSFIDQVFWLSALTAAYVICSDFFKENGLLLLTLLGAEALTYIVSYLKFRKEVATHAIASKIWTLTILATLVQLMATCDSGWLFMTCFYLGMITRMEIIAILFIIRKWENDVPSLYHAVMIRKGKPIKRNKLFNG